MDRYEKLRSLAVKAQNLAREIALAKGDFDEIEGCEEIERAEDSCDDAYHTLWGVEGRFRFEWRGLTMIAETRWSSISLDTDRHPIGTLCHSPSGYRSFSGAHFPTGCSPEDGARGMLDAYVDGPTTHGMGLAGKLVRYVPWWIDLYRQSLEYMQRATPQYRAECPAMTPPEDRAAYWAEQDAKHARESAEAERKAAAAGIDLAEFIPALTKARQGALL